MQTDDVYVGLGSNLGNRAVHLGAGLEGLRRSGLAIRAVSSLYLTEPDLGTESSSEGDAHPWYVNCVVRVGGADDARRLLDTCLTIEQGEGRSRRSASGCPDDARPAPLPRRLDLDVLLFGEAVIEGPGLRVPHPRMHERRFVLQPLAELAADTRHPEKDLTVGELLARLPDAERVWLLAPPPRVA